MSWRGRALVAAAVVILAVRLDASDVPGAAPAGPRGGAAPAAPTAPATLPGPAASVGGPRATGSPAVPPGAPGSSLVIDKEAGVEKTGGQETAAQVGPPEPPGADHAAEGPLGAPGSPDVVENSVVDKTNSTAPKPGLPAETASVDSVGVPGSSYVVDRKENVDAGKSNLTISKPPGPPAEAVGGDGIGVPDSSYVVDRKENVDAGKTNSSTSKPSEPPAETVSIVSVGVPVSSNVDAGKINSTASKPSGSPATTAGGDSVGVPGTTSVVGEKLPVKPDPDSAAVTGPPKPAGASENVDEDRFGVPGTSYIDGEKPATPDAGSGADIVFPRSADRFENDSPGPDGPSGGKVGAVKLSKRSVAEGRKRKTKKSNAKLLRRLGLVKLRTPAVNHHRKRLASQSREAHRPPAADSKMFVIKLPPEPYYFASHDENEAKRKPAAALPVSFSSNGKPSRVYHWNIPLLKKMVARKAVSPKAAFGDGDAFSVDKQATWNDTGDEKPLHHKTAYYAPKKASKEAFRKYFTGNGKPHSFYVMGKSDKPKSTYKLIPSL